MTQLITVPTFTFSQGEVYDGHSYPIQVCYYNGVAGKVIELRQGDNAVEFFDVAQLGELLKEVKRHLPDATVWLDR